jgi:hypothetical protein
MLWSKQKAYEVESFELESDLEEAILEVQTSLFGPSRIYLNAKKKIDSKKSKRNILDGYLIDLTSAKEPKLAMANICWRMSMRQVISPKEFSVY